MERVRHYTRISAMRKILDEERIVARDQNMVFVDKASQRRLSPRDVEKKYDLDRGKGNAYVEFDIEDALLLTQYNRRLKLWEFCIVGDIDLAGRHADPSFNW